jgi:hypothetical protein
VDLSRELTETLQALQIDRQWETITQQWTACPVWIFCNAQGHLFHNNLVRKAFHHLLKQAGVRRVRFHDLRHTFASLLLQIHQTCHFLRVVGDPLNFIRRCSSVMRSPSRLSSRNNRCTRESHAADRTLASALSIVFSERQISERPLRSHWRFAGTLDRW